MRPHFWLTTQTHLCITTKRKEKTQHNVATLLYSNPFIWQSKPMLHIQTPLIPSLALSEKTGKAIWLKLEASQPSGSFKMRGIGHACKTYLAQGKTRFVASSGGNAGLAVAYAAHQLSVPALVVVPVATSQQVKTLLQQMGAEVIVQGASWQEANDALQSLIQPEDAFIHPFDDALLWQGHASLVEEIAKDFQKQDLKPDAIVLSVGGGGLLAGVHRGLAAQGWTDVPIIAVETEGAASLHDSMQAGKRIQLEHIHSIATTLGAKQICQQAFTVTQEHPVHPVLVSDEAAMRACVDFADAQRIIVEPACGAALAPVYANHEVLEPFQTIVVIVCGGSSATVADLQSWRHALS